jgi:2-polyprenyl-6-hydroxyphenyl methylase/3-demethylubiquinone-9 3-methyltransferase
MKLDDFIACFEGSTDAAYLKDHYPRLYLTKELVYQGWDWEKADILDVGAHWLHQSVYFALDGHHVTAADFATTLEDEAVREIAAKFNIDSLVYEDLSVEHALDALDDDSMDVILFCEILEHITFNPVAMWKAFYRVLRPGGRIIITTPNFYHAGIMFPAIFRFWTGWGSGISVVEILNKNTYSPHWKEYSKKEISRYFELLSPDFVVKKQRYLPDGLGIVELNWKGKLLYDKRNILPVFRKGIYSEIELLHKDSGITISPRW